MEVKVTGSMWSFEFDYGNGIKDSDLIVPVGKPVVLRMTSNDVISLLRPACLPPEGGHHAGPHRLHLVPARQAAGDDRDLRVEFCGNSALARCSAR